MFGKLTVEGGRSTECDWRRGEMCDGAAVIVFEDGAVFTGRIEGGVPNGKGAVVKYGNDDVYDGEMRDGARCGEGRCLFANGEEFSGRWENDGMCRGKLTLAGGAVQDVDESAGGVL